MQIDNEVILDKVQKFLVKTASELLKIHDMEIDREFEEYGFDSIINTQYVNKISEYYPIELMPTVLFQFEEPTIRTLAEYLCNKYGSELHSFYEKEINIEENVPEPAVKEQVIPEPKQARFYAQPEGKPEAQPEFHMTSRFIHPDKRTISVNLNEAEAKPSAPVEESVDREHEPIAIIGMQGKFPHSEDLNEFWNNLKEGRNLVTETPKDRFNWEEYDDPALRWGAFMDDIDKFDADFFGIAKQDAEAMDPQHRLFIEAAWSAIEDAGYKPSDLSGTNTAVYVGIGAKDYSELMNLKNGMGYNPFAMAGRESFMLCNRLSSMLNLHGPSEAIYTTCSSSLLAVHKAVESIHIGASEMAIVGGVNIILTPSNYMAYSEAGLLSKTGQCRVFDKDADGTVRSEGVGAVILKSLSAAVRDGDHIYALVKATAQNHKGKSASLTAPNSNAEADLIMDVFHKAKVDPATVNYIEAHSTGTKLGDPIEITAINKALQELYQENGTVPASQSCAISSLKANIGHLETASGIAALMKVVLSLNHHQILGVGNFKELSPYIDLSGSPLYINDHNRNWNRTAEGVPRRAGVSAFGYGGVNAHVMVEEYMGEDRSESSTVRTKDRPAVILLSAKNKDRLKEQARLLGEYLEENQVTDNELADIAYTLQIGREAYEERLAFTAVSVHEVRDTLFRFVKGEETSVLTGRAQKKNDIIHMLEQDKGMEDIISSWMNDEEYGKLLKLWVSGWQINWKMLYKDEKRKRISLPTYPYEKNHYWLDMDDKAENQPKQQPLKRAEPPKQKVEEVTKIRKAEDKEKKELVKHIIRNAISELLAVDVNEIGDNEELADYGIDSIVLTQLLQQLQDIDRDLDFETLYCCKTLNEILDSVHIGEEAEVHVSEVEADKEPEETEVKQEEEVKPEKKKEAPKKHNGELELIAKEHEITAKLMKEAESYERPTRYPEMIRLNKPSKKRPIFWFHGGFGGVEIYRIVSKNIDRPFYGIQAKGYLTEESPILGMEDMAAYYIKLMKSVQQEGPYDLGGLSMGGLLAYEVAKQLQDAGDKVNSIVMLESIYQDIEVKKTWSNTPAKNIKKERMLRAVNLLLGFTSSVQLNLISEEEVNLDDSEEEFLNQLIELSKKRGSKKTPLSLRKSILELERLLHTLDVSSSIYNIPELSKPEEVHCYYFCNDNGALFTEEGTLKFFQIGDKEYVFDYVECARKWKKNMPNLDMIEIHSPSHFTILSEPKSQKTITDFCGRLYSDQEMTEDFIKPFLLKK